MKILTSIVMFVLLGVYANAQREAKVIAELAAGPEKAVKNAPFSAEAVSESVQVLADGNRIVRNSTSKLFRNSEGRFRREMQGGSGGVFNSFYSFGQGISILDPVVGHRYLLDSHLKTARIMELKAGQLLTIAESAKVSDELKADARQKAILAEKMLTRAQKLDTELKATAPMVSLTGRPGVAFATTIGPGGEGGFGFVTGGHDKYETKTEELGTRDFDGISAEGKRTVTTIPAEAIGNERPIEIAYERWHSKELELVVYSKHSDPRFGDQTYRLTNIVRSEPAPSLFTVPAGYKVTTEPAGFYHLRTTRAIPARPMTAPRRPAALKPISVVNVKTTKP